MKQLLNEEEIRNKFGEYLMKYHDLDREDAEIATYDFPDPFNNCYIKREFEQETVLDGKICEVFTCTTEFWMFQTFNHDAKPFTFNIYYYFDEAKKRKRTVKQYTNAPKMYELTCEI